MAGDVPSNPKIDRLSAIAWDLRTFAEAQVRTLTALQRCLDDYRKTREADALVEARKHVRELTARAPQANEVLRTLDATLSNVAAEHQ